MGKFDDAEVLGVWGTNKVKWTFLREAGKASWRSKHLNEGCRKITTWIEDNQMGKREPGTKAQHKK